MPLQTFRGDPYRVLGVDPNASDAAIKRRWRELARELHPDRAANPEDAARMTRRMARVTAAYDLLRDPGRRALHDAHAGGRRDWTRSAAAAEGVDDMMGYGGPPPPRPTRPVTARFDTSRYAHRRNAAATEGLGLGLEGQRPLSARERRMAQEPLRASDPCGPVFTRRTGRRIRMPKLEEARDTVLQFGKFRGHTLGQVEAFEPTYIDWIAGTITRDRDLVMRARVIQADMDERGIERRRRSPAGEPGRGGGEAA